MEECKRCARINEVSLVRTVTVGLICLAMVWTSSCWMMEEMKLKQIEAVGGRIEKVQRWNGLTNSKWKELEVSPGTQEVEKEK